MEHPDSQGRRGADAAPEPSKLFLISQDRKQQSQTYS